MLNKLSSYFRQNGISTALREMGKIEKTIFILDYLSSEELRKKIQRGLNKGEAMKGLTRGIFFGKQGELRERTVENQLQRASALNIIINAINIWNTLYLEKAIEYRKTKGNFNEDLIANIYYKSLEGNLEKKLRIRPYSLFFPRNRNTKKELLKY